MHREEISTAMGSVRLEVEQKITFQRHVSAGPRPERSVGGVRGGVEPGVRAGVPSPLDEGERGS